MIPESDPVNISLASWHDVKLCQQSWRDTTEEGASPSDPTVLLFSCCCSAGQHAGHPVVFTTQGVSLIPQSLPAPELDFYGVQCNSSRHPFQKIPPAVSQEIQYKLHSGIPSKFHWHHNWFPSQSLRCPSGLLAWMFQQHPRRQPPGMFCGHSSGQFPIFQSQPVAPPLTSQPSTRPQPVSLLQ